MAAPLAVMVGHGAVKVAQSPQESSELSLHNFAVGAHLRIVDEVISMGTAFFFDQMMPAEDREAKDGDLRQLEIFRPSGGPCIELRVGLLNEEHQGRGVSIHFTPESAREFLDGAERAFSYLGWLSDE